MHFCLGRRIGRQEKELGIKTVADVYEYFRNLNPTENVVYLFLTLTRAHCPQTCTRTHRDGEARRRKQNNKKTNKHEMPMN